jgi:hypothetical protein
LRVFLKCAQDTPENQNKKLRKLVKAYESEIKKLKSDLKSTKEKVR